MKKQSMFARYTSSSTKEEKRNQIVASLPGIATSGGIMLFARGLSELAGEELYQSGMLASSVCPISGVSMSIIMGILMRNAIIDRLGKRGVSLSRKLSPGLKTATTSWLRAGIICVGFKLSAFDLAELGALGVPACALTIGSGLMFGHWISNRLRLDTKLASLIAAGTSICGVTAIASLAPVIRANTQHVSIAVANIVAFGLIGMCAYPFLVNAMFDMNHPFASEMIGSFLGLAIADTSQVMGAALNYAQMFQDEVALRVAAITKLTRNLSLAFVIPMFTMIAASKSASSSSSSTSSSFFSTMRKYIPGFVLAFIAAACIRTLGDFIIDKHDLRALRRLWEATVEVIGTDLPADLMGVALAALGLSTQWRVFHGVGMRPLLAGLSTTMVVASVAYIVSRLMGSYLLHQRNSS